MHVLAAFAILLVTAAPDGSKAKPPTKAEQAAADAKKAADDDAKKADDDTAAKRAADDSAANEAKKAADELTAKRAAEDATRAEQGALTARGLDARMRALCDLVAPPLKRLPGDYREQRFAVLPFEEVGSEVQDKKLGAVVGDLVVTNLARDHHLPLVERAALAKILDEQALGQTGALADGQAVTVGKVAGARALIIGQVSDAGDSFRVSVRAVDAESGSVIDGTAREVKLPKEELIAFSANAVVLKSKSGALFRSIVLPGWGQAYNDEPVKAGVFGATTGGLALATLATAGVGSYVRFVVYAGLGRNPSDLKDPAKLQSDVVSARTNGEATLVASGVLAGLTATAWSIGALDAYLSGTDIENLDAALAQN